MPGLKRVLQVELELIVHIHIYNIIYITQTTENCYKIMRSCELNVFLTQGPVSCQKTNAH
jgi:hypothetical protein